jgi:hypothetical protein
MGSNSSRIEYGLKSLIVIKFPISNHPREFVEMPSTTRFRDGILVGYADEQLIAFIVMNVIVHRARHGRGGDDWDTNRDLTVANQ